MTPYIYFLLGGISMGFNGIFVKFLSENLTSVQIGFVRFFLGSIFLLLLLILIDKEKIRLPKLNELKEYVFLGFLLAVTAFLVAYAFIALPVQITSLILALSPLFVAAMSYYIIKEKIPRNFILSFFLGFTGLVILNPFNFTSGLKLIGISAAFSTLFLVGLFVTYERKEDKKASLEYLFWVFVVASLILFILMIPSLGTINLEGISWTSIILLGLLPGCLAYYFLNKAMETLSADFVAISEITIVPLSSILLAFLFVGESVTMSTMVASLFLISSGGLLFIDEIRSHFVKKSIVKRV